MSASNSRSTPGLAALLALLSCGGVMLGCRAPGLAHVGAGELDRLLERETASGHAPGVVVAVAWADGRTLVRSAGRSRLSPPAPATAETLWPWFSVTKLFTATAVLVLVDEGKVVLDEPVSRYLPSFAPRGGRAPTVRELLAHTSGLANPIPVTWIHLAEEAGPTLDELTARLLAAHGDLEFEPGSRFQYSNLGYLVLGQLVERASGEGYQAYVADHVLAPLGMSRTSFSVSPAVATGYSARWSVMGLAAWWMLDKRYFGDTQGGLTALLPFAVDGAPYGGLVGPAPEMVRIGLAMLAGGRLDGRTLLSPATAAAALAPTRSRSGAAFPIGLGWHLGEVDGEPYARHLGGGGGFRSELRLYPRLGYVIAVIGNETSFVTEALARLVVEP